MKIRIINARIALLTAALLVFVAKGTFAANTPGVFRVNQAPHYGKTYNEWVVVYWQWAMSIPFAVNPWANDPDGSFAANGQSGPVWFLGGTLGDSVTRTVTIPAGKAIFLPVHQWIFGATVFDCDPSVPGVPCDEQALKKTAAGAAKAVDSMEVSIDGESVDDVKDFRVVSSPLSFSVTVPDDNIATRFGSPVAAGTYSPHVADGYYMLLAPLSPGQHTISVHVVSTLGFEYLITYLITQE